MSKCDASGAALQEVDEWGNLWISPIAQAMLAYDHLASEQRLAAARAALAIAGFSADAQQGLELQLAYLQMKAALYFLPDTQAENTFRSVHAQLLNAHGGIVTTVIRNSRLIQVEETGEQYGWCHLERGNLYTLLEDIAASDRTVELDFFLASWAFRHQDLALLDMVIEDMELEQEAYNLQICWQRAFLMRRLLLDEAGDKDVLAYLTALRQRSFLRDFRVNIWPWLDLRDRITNELKEAFQQQLNQMLAQHYVPGERERLTATVAGSV